jgi:methylphosphotriester-DNA--protein-cysteine methyltransferase
MNSSKNPTENPAKTHGPLQDLCDWIDEHIHEQIGWTELMQVSGWDHQTLQSEFVRHKNMTPMTWIRKRREQLSVQATAVDQPLKLPGLLRKGL